MTPLLLRAVEIMGLTGVDGRPHRRVVDVTVEAGNITGLGDSLEVPAGGEIVDGVGCALLPGMWDHHIHLAALAAARSSVVVGPPEVTTPEGFAAVLRTAGGARRWVRAVGYHESVAGELDRQVLDRVLPHAPVRVQHRSGAMWVLNSRAITELGLDREQDGALDHETGRLYGGDRWLGERLDRIGARDVPDFAAVGRELARYGVTGVTDATPYDRFSGIELLADAASSGAVPQRIVAMGGPALTNRPFPGTLGRGPVKLLLADHDLPSLDQLVDWITAAHGGGRPIAAHCVTRASLVLALTALDIAGSVARDRIEHGAVVPPELRDHLAARSLTVVTQPNFVAERGDVYLADVAADDRPHLYPCASLLAGGIPVGGSTDAPFGHPDPWRAMAAAVDRRTVSGQPIGPAEAVPPRQALGLFLGQPDDPGGSPRRVAVGAPADLCLLDAPVDEALDHPSADRVRLTVIGGAVVHRA